MHGACSQTTSLNPSAQRFDWQTSLAQDSMLQKITCTPLKSAAAAKGTPSDATDSDPECCQFQTCQTALRSTENHVCTLVRPRSRAHWTERVCGVEGARRAPRTSSKLVKTSRLRALGLANFWPGGVSTCPQSMAWPDAAHSACARYICGQAACRKAGRGKTSVTRTVYSNCLQQARRDAFEADDIYR